MKKTLVLVLVSVAIVLAGCGSATPKKGEWSKPAEKPVTDTSPATRDDTFAPGKGMPEIQSELTIEVLPVKGNPILIKDDTFVVLYGAGPEQEGKNLAKVLKSKGIKYIDYLIQPSSDPAGYMGAMGLAGEIQIGNIERLIGDENFIRLERAVMGKSMIELLAAGSIWYLNGVSFDILYPMQDDFAGGRVQDKTSVVLVTKGKVSFLLTAQIDGTAENKLIQRGKLKKVSAVIATNGAPEGSMTEGFMKALSPEKVFVVANKDAKPATQGTLLAPGMVLRTDGETLTETPASGKGK
ncbi:MAG: hypothetical protein GYA78_03700 [Caldisericales bacterium]|nr:hypothetical protein [Caldisericales bacterium]